MRESTNQYLDRFGLYAPFIKAPPSCDLRLVLVIPCFNEPDLITTLKSIHGCGPTIGSVEILVIINSGVLDSSEIRQLNLDTYRKAGNWAVRLNTPERIFRFILLEDLSKSMSGVGNARKVGMDEAVRRFEQTGNHEDGIIACCDADCTVSFNYLSSLEQHFGRECDSPGCSVYFEHPIQDGMDADLDQAILHYELHLRYYVQALRFAGYPFAYHTVVSSMAVRSSVYQKQGGMNRKKAGEDFYFLQKIIPLGNFTELTDCVVKPSSRPSDRVPFGTGKAVQNFLLDGRCHQLTEPLQAFIDLKKFLLMIPSLYIPSNAAGEMNGDRYSPAMLSYLLQHDFASVLTEIRSNVASADSFIKRLYQWWNPFRVMKFIHHARDEFYGSSEVLSEVRIFFESLCKNTESAESMTAQELLSVLRTSQKTPWTPANIFPSRL
ncbi:MAG TPA: glycosyltransferase family 2 protein [Verrucomicrobiales bacterium]|nr:glycosyltransferase family 2 protein [Verrucomicrobiales bacterium]